MIACTGRSNTYDNSVPQPRFVTAHETLTYNEMECLSVRGEDLTIHRRGDRSALLAERVVYIYALLAQDLSLHSAYHPSYIVSVSDERRPMPVQPILLESIH